MGAWPEICINSLLTGKIAPLGPRQAPSGIIKSPREGKVWLGSLGFRGDEQGDKRHHGGVEKAVHHYPFDYYPIWRDEIGDKPLLQQAGAFGENISTLGLTEKEVAIGDRFRLGDALIEVSQGRQPCWKLNYRFDVPDMALRVQKSGRSGWYYRVLEEGYVESGDYLLLQERLSPKWTLHRLWHVLYIDMLNYDELSEMAALAHLPEGWRRYAVKRLENRKVEDWSKRLTGMESD